MTTEEFWALIDQWKRDNPWYDGVMRAIDLYEEMLPRMPYVPTYTSGSSEPMRLVIEADGNWHWEPVE